MNKYNWTHFTKRVTIRADADTIFRAWTTQAGLESWFLRLAEFKGPDGVHREGHEEILQGDNYRWLWHGYDDSTAECGELLMTNRKDEMQFTFSGGCIVKVTIKEEDGETICELSQTMPMNDEVQQQHFFIECGTGWTFYMANLKSTLEGGVDLRNKNENIRRVINS